MVSKVNALVRILINGVEGTGLMTESPLSFNKLNQCMQLYALKSHILSLHTFMNIMHGQ